MDKPPQRNDRRLVQRHARYRRTVRLEFYRDEVSAPDISERYRALLALLRPHLPQAYLDAERRRHGAPRHWERLRLVAAPKHGTEISAPR